MYVVEEGDVVKMRISNSSGEVHPMHLHGHHAVVLARNGEAGHRQPVVVRLAERQERRDLRRRVRRRQPRHLDGPLPQPQARAQGLVTHLMYAGVTEPYRVGGKADNEPE